MSSPFSGSQNFILTSLPPDERERLAPHLRLMDATLGTVIQEPEEEVRFVYFVEAGMISLVMALEDGSIIEVAVVGTEGMSAPNTVVEPFMPALQAMVQIPGRFHRIEADVLREVALECPTLRRLANQYSYVLFEQAAISVACNSKHDVLERLARWLLLVSIHTESQEFRLTHEFMAQMLAVRRPSVTTAAITLQGGGLIEYRHGRIKILDKNELAKTACECVETNRLLLRRFRGEA